MAKDLGVVVTERCKLEYSECLLSFRDGCVQADNLLVVAEMQSIPDNPTLRMSDPAAQRLSGLTCCHAASPPHHSLSSRQSIHQLILSIQTARDLKS
jgi:hypothetical protein